MCRIPAVLMIWHMWLIYPKSTILTTGAFDTTTMIDEMDMWELWWSWLSNRIEQSACKPWIWCYDCFIHCWWYRLNWYSSVVWVIDPLCAVLAPKRLHIIWWCRTVKVLRKWYRWTQWRTMKCAQCSSHRCDDPSQLFQTACNVFIGHVVASIHCIQNDLEWMISDR